MSGSIRSDDALNALPAPQPVEAIAPVDAATFARDVAPAYRPVIMKGLVADWPAVLAGRAGDTAVARYVAALDTGTPTTMFEAPAEQNGRFFYAPDMRGWNFTQRPTRIAELLARLLALRDDPAPPALYAGSTPTAQGLPGFADANVLPLDTQGGEARIWIGNATQVATHYDMSPNIACVVAGRRRFTLFPPEQVANLYVGPLDRTPAGQPVSMVDPLNPDLDVYPRYAEAARHALVADLEPGDALYIPSLWWHHVAASAPLNLLVNYWFAGNPPGSPFAAMMHAVYAIRELPEGERTAWRAWFDNYVFGGDAPEAASHLPIYAQGVTGPASPRRDDMIRAYVAQAIMRKK